MPRLFSRLTARNPRWVLTVFLILTLVGSLLFVRRRDNGSPFVRIGADGRYYWAYLTSLVLDRDLDFTNQYANTRSGNYYGYLKTPTGHFANVATIGPALTWMPTFIVAYAVSKIVEPAAESADGTSDLTQVITLYASFLLGLAAMWLAYLGGRSRYGPGPACAGAVAGIACGPVLHYLINQPHYAHAASAFAVTALLYVWDVGRGARTLRGWMLLGALVGLAMLMRTQNLAFALPAVVEGAVTLVRGARAGGARGLLRACAGPMSSLAVALLVFLPQMIAWKVIYGHWVGVPQGAGYIRWGASAWSETLFSSRNGLFPYAPVWLVGILGLILVARRDRWLALGLGATFALTTYMNGAFWHWWGMGSFGGRRFDGLVYPVALGIAALVHVIVEAWARRPRLAAGLVLGAGGLCAVAWNGLMSIDMQNHIGGAQPEAVSTLDYYNRVAMVTGRDVWRWGNPIELPAALVFSWRTGAPAARYEDVVGPQLLDGFQGEYQKPTPEPRAELSFASKASERYLVYGFGPPRGTGKDSLRPMARRARVLVPLNIITGVAGRLRGTGSAETTLRVRWNGDVVASAPIAAGAPIDLPFSIPPEHVERGINIVDLEVDGLEAGSEAAALSQLGLGVAH